jgi:hypothetical protein
MAESAETRFTPRDMLAELDSCVARGRRAEILDAFTDAVTPLYSLLIAASGPHRGDGNLTHAIVHLVARSITDLIAAMHLASHGYLQQVHTLVRPVHESCDLIEMFAQHPEEATRWVQSETQGFKGHTVRNRILEPPESLDVYRHLSERGPHPRFVGSQISTAFRVSNDDPSNRQLVTRVGAFFDWHPSTVLVYTWVFDAVTRLALKTRHLELALVNVTRDQWVAACLESTRAVSRGCKLIRQELVALDADEDAEFLDTV